MTVWTFQEYANSPANNWAVRAIRLNAPPPPVSTPNVTVPTGQASTIVICTSTGSPANAEFFDPGPAQCGGPAYANHLAATATNGVTVNGVSDQLAQVLLNLNTVNAPANSSTVVTIANPDGRARDLHRVQSAIPPASPWPA